MPVSQRSPSEPELRVILLVSRDARRRRLSALLGRIDPRCRVETAASPVEASAHLTRAHAHLLVLDLALAQGQPIALIHHLARFAPLTTIVALDEAPAALPIRPYDVWAWDAAEQALREAIGAQRRNAPASSHGTEEGPP